MVLLLQPGLEKFWDPSANYFNDTMKTKQKHCVSKDDHTGENKVANQNDHRVNPTVKTNKVTN